MSKLKSVGAVIAGFLTVAVLSLATDQVMHVLAPGNPMRHVWVLAFIGLAAATAGAIVAIPLKLGPAWFPIALVVTAVPLTWLGGFLHRTRSAPAAAP